MAYTAPFLRSVKTSCSSCRGFFWTVMKTKNWKRAFSKLNRFWGWKVLLKHTWSNAACYPNLIWPCFHNHSVQTDKTARAPLRQLVCLESLQRLAANDLQTNSLAGLACPAALCFLCLYLTVLEPMWRQPHSKSSVRTIRGGFPHLSKTNMHLRGVVA